MKTEQIVQSVLGAGLNGLSAVNQNLTGQIGFRLFCMPFSPKLRPHQEEYLTAAKDTTMKLNDKLVQTYRWGNGQKKLLFLHGWRSNAFRWKPYIDKINLEEYTVFAFDAPAHGLSDGKILNAPLYGQAIHQFLSDQPVEYIVAHSIGAFATSYAIYHYDLQVDKLILLGSPSSADDFINRFRETLQLKHGVISAIEKHFLKLYDRPPSYFDTSMFLQEITIPGLIIHDEGDDLAPIADAYKNHEAWKNSKLIVTKDLGHRLKNNKVIDQVLQFLAE